MDDHNSQGRQDEAKTEREEGKEGICRPDDAVAVTVKESNVLSSPKARKGDQKDTKVSQCQNGSRRHQGGLIMARCTFCMVVRSLVRSR